MNPPAPESPAPTPEEQAVVDEVLDTYSQGWFPMGEGGKVDWVRPEKRGLIPLDDRFGISKSLAKVVRSGRFIIKSDTAFSQVIRACAKSAPGREQTWLHPAIVRAFGLLHRVGKAHSVEAWLVDKRGAEVLVGGLYGLAIGGAFFGESMFSRPLLGGTDASKVCLVRLVNRLRADGYDLLDAQIWNAHLAQFGCYEVDDGRYMEMLGSAITNSPGCWARGVMS